MNQNDETKSMTLRKPLFRTTPLSMAIILATSIQSTSIAHAGFFDDIKEATAKTLETVKEAPNKLLNKEESSAATHSATPQTQSQPAQNNPQQQQASTATSGAPTTKAAQAETENLTAQGENAEELSVEAARDARKAELLNQQKELVLQYVATAKQLADAQARIAKALGLKEAAAAVKESAEALSSGHSVPTKKSLKKQIKVSKRTNALIKAKLNENSELASNSQIKFVEGIGKYALALSKTKEIGIKVKQFTDGAYDYYQSGRKLSQTDTNTLEGKVELGKQLLGASRFFLNRSFSSSTFIAKQSPSILKNHGEALKISMNYAKRKEIPVPDQATTLLGSLNIDGDS